jgi:hypothetical protein
MQATQGLADLFHLRARVIGYAIAFALALSALALALASSARAAEPPHKTYLGSGTSIAFGYSQELFNENFPTENPANFESVGGKPNGVVLDYYHILQAEQTPESTWTRMTNDGCPGETSQSYIGNNATGKTLEAIIAGVHTTTPCGYHNVNGFELHHPYKGGKDFEPSKAESQLENVMETIAIQNTGHNATQHPVSSVTIDLGANDILAVVKQCEKEVAEGLWPGNPGANIPPLTECEVAHLPASIKELATQVSAVLFAIRNGSLLCFSDCDGADDQGVNYNGPIIFAGFYNPFGAVFVPGEEVNPGSNFLDIVINLVMAKTVKNFGVCYANPQRSPANHAHAFNPLINGEPALEPERLQKWTNMANFSFAVGGNKQKNGPDIHPTPEGYQVSAEIYSEECA